VRRANWAINRFFMSETFLILLAGGIMLAAVVSDPREVTLQWLRLGGILALSTVGLGVFFYVRRETVADVPAFYGRVQVGLVVATVLCVLGQLAFVQVARRGVQRFFAAAAFVCAVQAGANLLHEAMVARGTAVRFSPKALAVALQTLSCAGVGATTGLALMDMLLGHAYLTASKMTMSPFRRLNLAVAAALAVRAVGAVPLVLWLQARRPVEMLWAVYGLYIGTRWLVGLVVPAVFLYMAHDCIKRRSTQAATGILYVCGVLLFIGEIVALYLVRETGLPF
jgi:hypothetical protein